MCSLTDDLDFEAGVPSDFKQTSKYQRGVDRNEKPQMQLVSSYLSLVLGGFQWIPFACNLEASMAEGMGLCHFTRVTNH